MILKISQILVLVLPHIEISIQKTIQFELTTGDRKGRNSMLKKKEKYLTCRGVKFLNDEVILSERVRESITAGRYEGNEANEVEKLIKNGDRILELGAGLGFISTIAARHPLVESVLSFEADPRLIGYIKKVHELNNVEKAEIRNAVLTVDPSLDELPFLFANIFGDRHFLKTKENTLRSIK